MIHNIAELNGPEAWYQNFVEYLQDIYNNIWIVLPIYFYDEKKIWIKKLKLELYKNVIIDNNYTKSNKIFDIYMLIDLNIAYAEYHN